MIGPVVDPARDLRGDRDFRRVASTARILVVASHPGRIADRERREHLSALLFAFDPLAVVTATLPFLGDATLSPAAQTAVEVAHEAAVAAVNDARGHS